MKKLLLVCMILGSLVSAKAKVIGGITYSNVSGNDVEKEFGLDPENLLGFKVGFEITSPSNGLITGAAFSQRGFSLSENPVSLKWKVNYLTGFILKPIPIQPGIDFLVGGEAGYYIGGNLELCFDGECDDEDIDSEDWDDMFGGQMMDFGPVFGLRYEISKTMSLNGTYYFGLTEWGDDMDPKNRGFQFY